MELDDCAFPLLAGIDIHDDPKAAFDGCNVGLLSAAARSAAGDEQNDELAEPRRPSGGAPDADGGCTGRCSRRRRPWGRR